MSGVYPSYNNAYDMIIIVVIMIVIIVMIIVIRDTTVFFFHSYDMMNSHLIAGAHGKDVGELPTIPRWPEDTYEPNDAESIQTLGLI